MEHAELLNLGMTRSQRMQFDLSILSSLSVLSELSKKHAELLVGGRVLAVRQSTLFFSVCSVHSSLLARMRKQIEYPAL